ncbi:nitrogen regulation protein NR(II) [Thermodesulfobacteriota bacterium]
MRETKIINEQLNQEIRERKQAEEALQKSGEKFRSIIENLVDVYFETTLDGIIKNISPSIENYSGYSVAELIGSKVDMLYHNPEDREGLLNELRDKGNVRGFELLFKKKNGEFYEISVNADIICNEDAQPIGMTGTIRDITQQKKLKDQLQRSKKMESLGLMASGIAHDLNNILSGVVGYPDLLLLQLPEDSPLRKSVETIKDSGQRAADVVSDLLTIAKGAASVKLILTLNSIVEEYLISPEHKRLEQDHPGVAFENDLDAELLNISCSSPHMKKILMNLVLNAYEAIDGQGKVCIKTANRYLEEPLRGYEDVQAGEYVLLTVTDTGSGISRDDIEMIFEPFFSKKVLGRSGTGLGLA